MNPGRELDALVAEKVMGWRRMTYAQIYAAMDPKSHGYRNDDRFTIYWHSDELDSRTGTNKEMALAEDSLDYYQPEDAWSPSTDIAAAWEVVEKLGGNMFQLHYDTRYGHESKTGWSVVLDGAVMCEFIDTAPHAICLAALKAMGVEVPDTD